MLLEENIERIKNAIEIIDKVFDANTYDIVGTLPLKDISNAVNDLELVLKYLRVLKEIDN